MSKEDYRVKIYSTPTCFYCHKVKDYFREKKIRYEDIDISINQRSAKEMIDRSGQIGVPVIIIKKDTKEEIITGFDREKINEVLQIK